MDAKKTLKTALSQSMDRRQFLAYVGLAVLSVLGVASFLRSIREGLSPKTAQARGASYGGASYGGGSTRGQRDS